MVVYEIISIELIHPIVFVCYVFGFDFSLLDILFLSLSAWY